MTSLNFKKWNIILGWIVFLIALITFSLTVEPTASYWDCAEYIATSAKLQVGHPPGAPFFQMMGAIFATFATAQEEIAKMVNYLSVFSSAFTILFMFWSITNLVRKMALKRRNENEEAPEFTMAKKIAVLGSGLVGSLAFTFSDSFWFSAVEAEVYAMAICIMSVLFWLALRWADEMHTPRGNKWLILISLVVGLSFGVHFMGLLTIPAIGMIYFFKNYKVVTIQNFIVANVVSIGVLLFIFKLLLPNALRLFGYLEVFFVNTFGMPFNSGSIIAALLVIGGFYYGLNYTRKKNLPLLNTILLCTIYILIGFSTWLMIPIRANANTIINENNPSDARSLLAYYNLEQYPETHLLYGPMYTDIYGGLDAEEPYVDDKPKYERDYNLGKYVIVNQWKGARQNSDSNHRGFLPRMWSSEHAENYMEYSGLLDFEINPRFSRDPRAVDFVDSLRIKIERNAVTAEEFIEYIKSDVIIVEPPSLLQNIDYLINYQMGHMYWRYFMWNFVGRQDDIQGKLDNHGNWLSGIKLIDELHLGRSQDNLPSDVLNNKARNTYYFLPLLFGIFGFVFLLTRGQKQFWVLFVFFMFTGLALKLYLNERPFEPRERDYALVGSFYVFAMWIGYGVYALFDTIKSYVANRTAVAGSLTVIALLAVPVLMASQNWDDHDRSNRYTAQSTAKAYLNSIQEDVGAMIFTIGDNDTFALWYAQDVEEYRTDVRTINTSLLGTDWYIDQMKRKAYKSEAVPSEMIHDQYKHGTRNYIRYHPNPKYPDSTVWELDRFMNWVLDGKKESKYGYVVDELYQYQEEIPESQRNVIYYPVNKVRVPVNKENAKKYVDPKDYDKIVDYIDIELPKSAIYKNSLMMLDILNQNDWKRPIYFTGGSFDKAEYIWMKDYLQLDGLVYKLIPIKTEFPNELDMGRVNSELMYKNVMKWDWGNSGSDDIYHDPQTRRQSISYRLNLSKLIEQLIIEGKNDKAENVIDLAFEKMPVKYFDFYGLNEPFIDGYFKIGKTEKALEQYNAIKTKYLEYLDYYKGVSLSQKYREVDDIYMNLQKYKSLTELLEINDQDELLEKELEILQQYAAEFGPIFRSFNGE
ncbi:protein O-mannosyl-transferase family [Kordia sp.]|uniref:glycosyltransferase family 117 protein n=1 Tax=Kordia sp. TaxID=1965332 RepID=UPI003D6AF5C9